MAHHGSVVAFEGNHDIISTQLRLLPSSPKVLIVPSIDHFLDVKIAAPADDLRANILRIHLAAAKRAGIVATFFDDSTPDNRKLVFLNGGTAAATAKCISLIRRHYVNTTIQEAEFLYHELVRNGVAGLQHPRTNDEHSSKAHSSIVGNVAQRCFEEDLEEPLDDPISRAMKAADALDRETESLQPNNELDLTTTPRPRSMSVPGLYFPDDVENAAPFYVFGAPENSCLSMTRETQRTITRDLELFELCEKSDSSKARSTALRALQSLEKCLGTADYESTIPSCVGEPYDLATQAHDEIPAVILSARLVDLRRTDSLVRATPKRVRSVDRVYATAARNSDASLCRFSKAVEVEHQIHRNNSQANDRRLLRSRYCSDFDGAAFSQSTRCTAKRTSQLSIARINVKGRPSSDNDTGSTNCIKYTNQSTETNHTYVDRGVDAIEPHLLHLDAVRRLELPSGAPFVPVLPMLEDLVIHFKGDQSDVVLDTMISGLQEGTYPVSLPPLLPGNDEDRSSSRSSTSSHESARPNSDTGYCGMSTSTAPTSVYPADADDYDPFASHGDYLRPAEHTWESGQADMAKHEPTMHMAASLGSMPKSASQAQTSTIEKNFHAFETTNCCNAVGIQNSLRSILNIYFPPQDGGLDHLKFPSLPEMGSLWNPVFRDGETEGSQARNTSIDLILAIGAQKGVDRSFLGAISGSLEKLGSKQNGISRSGRLDLRYLIANAMQTFTAQPLANQAKDNPFTNSLLLATLIIPFLELYLATHTDTRFLLLEYPPEHLTTVLALQRLIGVDLIKVAGIIDAEAGGPKAFPGFKPQSPLRPSHSADRSVSCMSMASATSVGTTATLLVPGARKTEAPSFSKANFLLTSSATESEIATLISTIWKLLVDISPFYIPEGTPRTRNMSENRQVRRVSSDLPPRSPTPLIDSTVQYGPLVAATSMMGFPSGDIDENSISQHFAAASPVTSPTALSRADSLPSPPDNLPPTPPYRSSRTSFAETIKSSKTMQSMTNQRKKIRGIMMGREQMEFEPPIPSRPATMEGSFFDLSDEEDSRFAADERRYMPLFGKTPVVRKGNSRKALKWLGLSVEE
ncbi:hypothetical protein MN608_01094 [Microdochium nivale]|nr:hypothetical protein MN608_01094 [Microdochium nivale]